MASLELPFGVKVLNPKPADAKYDNEGTPYVNTTAAIAAIPAAIRYLGLTVNVNAVEYWWKDGTTDPDLIVKSSGTGDLSYTHTQGMAAQTWNINHNLGKRPAIHVEDMSGNEIIPQIIHIDNNNAQAVFGNSTYSGTAYCN